MATGLAGNRMSGGGKRSDRMHRWVLLTVLAGALSACATVDGMGQDISGGARTVQSWF